jgi:hypothetical protein
VAIVCLSDYDVTPSLVMRGATEAMVAEKPKPKTPPEMTLDGLKAANDYQKVGINIVRRAGEQQPRYAGIIGESSRSARELYRFGRDMDETGG